MPHMIERQDRIEQHEPGVVFNGSAGLDRNRLEPGCRVVSEVAHGAARESREITNRGRPELTHHAFERGHEGVARRRRDPGALGDGLAIARAKDEKRILPEERIAGDVLSAFDALEEKRVVGMLGNLEEGGDRGQQIGADLLPHRDERRVLGQRSEFLEGREPHGYAASRARTASRSVAAARIRSTEGRRPVHHLNCAAPCATSISSPPMAAQPAARASRIKRVSAGL